MRKEGLIRHVGLCDVGIDDIAAAHKYFPVATVQNRFNLINRSSEDVLVYCEQHNIGFIPWAPLAAGALAHPGSALMQTARTLKATPSQVALAWVLKRSKIMLPIPGTANPSISSRMSPPTTLELPDKAFDALDQQGRNVLSKSEA